MVAGVPREYTDCVEISFLSMLHAFLHSSTEVGALDERLVRDKLAGAPELQAWLREHPCLPNVEMLKSEEGVTQRTSWAEFLTGRDGLRYNGDGFELTACEENTAALFRDVAGLPPAAAESAQAVCAHFSAPGRVWSCERSESSDGSGLRTQEVAYSRKARPGCCGAPRSGSRVRRA